MAKNSNGKIKKNDSNSKCINEEELFNSKVKRKIYFSYNFRLIMSGLLCIFFLVLSIILICNSMDVIKEENVTYHENGTIDYKICLKENTFYESSCIDKDMSYVASLIKSIPLTFQYNFKANKEVNLDSKYEVKADLVISNSEDLTTYFKKTYVLVPLTKVKSETSNYSIIDRNVDIDYDYYNNIANEFKSQYGVDVKSSLNVSFVVYNKSSEVYLNPSTTTISIPLSQKSISVKINSSTTTNNNNQKFIKYVYSLTNIIYLVLGVVCVIFSILFIIRYLRLFCKRFIKKSDYDKYISKILKEYDRLIVETSSLPKLSDYNVIVIKKFAELLDVRDNLRLPIMYYNVISHQKCHLYILKDNNLYLLTLKAVDM